MTREALAVEPADVELAPLAAKPDRDSLLDVLRDAEVRREEVRGPGGHDREGGVRPGERIDRNAATVPSPPQTKSSSAPSSRARFTCSGANRLFAHFDPQRIVDALALELAAVARAGRRRTSSRRAR